MAGEQTPVWNLPYDAVMERLGSSSGGLTTEEAAKRLSIYGPNILRTKKRYDALTLLAGQFKSPIILILIFAALLSLFLHDSVDALIILAIVILSGLLGFWQERGAFTAVEKLLELVQIKATALRDGVSKEVPFESVVPGDVVILSAGDSIPGDCLILQSKDLFVDEAVLTGETFPEEKTAGVLPAETPLRQRTNALFMGTHVVSGSTRALVVMTGKGTEIGKISERLSAKQPETEFERGVRRFGYFLMEVTLMLVIAIFAINVYLARPVLDAFLFSLALAVGLAPQLLPAIISINLAHGAKRMAEKQVIVKRLASIENFGSMNVLCSDKTGTLTEGMVRLNKALDAAGNENEKVLLYAYLNAIHETGFINPIDEAIRTHKSFDVSQYAKLDEVPYDFIRKRLSIFVSSGNEHLMITKGAFMNVLSVCSTVEEADGTIADLKPSAQQIENRFKTLSQQGLRVLGVAYRHLAGDRPMSKDDENNMTFLGFIALFDPPKSGIAETLDQLKTLGVSVKIITGDNELIACNVCRQVGLDDSVIVTGSELHQMSDEALRARVNSVDVFAEVEPNHKEQIILALRKAGNVVGYMGDGINDASALHAADASISVDSAVDVAKDAADIVLLEKDLGVLVEGIREGRITFANTLKYVFMATSANFGNMFSMAGASLFLPFLPLLPKQILLTNLMTDFPEMAIATDSVDKELVSQPRRWNIKFIRNFMLIFGALSSVFDYLTFGALLFLLHATTDQFRTGWFVESVISASVIVLVIRSRRPFFRSRPGRYLLTATILVVTLTIIFPFSPLASLFGFGTLRPVFLLVLGGIMLLYIASAELAKRIFYRKVAL
ncbi:MAG TPA: magnesium-translocating P-type ATPase [Syntrophorhabdales bacterium]|nr:magnesium-translocating P-type ATPase [Syntrophorhabdales bacterium]